MDCSNILLRNLNDCGFENAAVFIDYIIEEGIAILLFDGLDEIPPEKRDILITILEQNKNTKSKIIISCRVDAIQSYLDGFWEVQVAKWDAKRINDFINKRFSNKGVRKKFIEELKDEKKKSLQDFKRILYSYHCCVPFINPRKDSQQIEGKFILRQPVIFYQNEIVIKGSHVNLFLMD